jgi:NAD(P)H-nitrite reductase large subunit
VVIGGDAAGMSAASQARRLQDPERLEIVAFERGPETSYSACGIPYWIGGIVGERDALVARAPQEFRDRQQIDVRTRSLVTAIDTGERLVQVTDSNTGREYTERYDELLIATGSEPVRPRLPGIEGDGVFGVHTLSDGAAVRAALDTGRVSRVVVIGAGYVGLETAEAMSSRGLHLGRTPSPSTTLGGQIVGREESAKRIDILATAIWNAMTAEQFFSADLSYAPPYSPVLDPVVIAARKTHDLVRLDAKSGGGLD